MTLSLQGALFESEHYDNNDVQTISHKCLVLNYKEYVAKKKEIRNNPQCDDDDEDDVYYLGGFYDPARLTMQISKDVPLKSWRGAGSAREAAEES